MTIEVLKPGMFSTVQDLGRSGYQQYGMLANGVMDRYSASLANILVGNKQSEAVIECTLIGSSLRFLADTTISITGAFMSPSISGHKLNNWQVYRVKSGAVLSLKGCESGARSYIAFAGGIDVNEILGSKSTYLRAKIGGYKGRALQTNDVLKTIPEKRLNKYWKTSKNEDLYREASWYVESDLHQEYPNEIEVRVIQGPQFNLFKEQSQSDFFKNKYIISSQSDRMGYRLSGIKLIDTAQKNPISEAMTFGSIQVPQDGQPIVLMADRQSVGGYPKIGNVISVDLPRLAQAKPGDSVKFVFITVKAAQDLYLEQMKLLKDIEFSVMSYYSKI
ncbi:MAG: antagonist of KipI [Francisellaceae bacterium]|jgi:antagonist of KipI